MGLELLAHLRAAALAADAELIRRVVAKSAREDDGGADDRRAEQEAEHG